MLAVRLHAVGEQLRVEEIPDPRPRGSQVRIRVAGCGVCRTDLHVVDGRQRRIELPRVLGHEVAGWLDEAGEAAGPELRRLGIASGDPVLIDGAWGCGQCRECAAGQEQRCAASVAPGFQADGGYAQLMLVPDPRHLLPLGDLDPTIAGPLADAGVTAYRAVTRVGPWLQREGRVLVIGAGGVGQFVIQHLRLSTAGRSLRIVAAEVARSKGERAVAIGASAFVLDADPASAVALLGGPADAVIDLVGDDAALALAAAVVAPDGAVALVGEAGGGVSFGFDRVPVESWLTTVAWGSRDDLRSVVERARDGRLTWDVERVPLTDAPAAHARLRAGAVTGRLVLAPPL